MRRWQRGKLRRAVEAIGVSVVVLALIGVAVAAAAQVPRPTGGGGGQRPGPPPPPRPGEGPGPGGGQGGGPVATTPLAIPPLLEPRVVNSVANFDLVARSGSITRGGARRASAGFNGTYLAPTIRVARGTRMAAHVRNEMADDTTVHWHGLHVPAAADGGPYQPIEPGTTWNPEPFRIDQPGTTLWYHPHLMGATERQVSLGMAGFLLIDDDTAAQEALPHRYGVDDIPLLVQPLPGGGGGGGGRGGQDDLAVNGTTGALLRTTQSRLRLRIVNASADSFLSFGVAGARASWQVGSDGGLLAAPLAATRVVLGPSERGELVVDVDAGRTVRLTSSRIGGRGGVDGAGPAPGRTLLTIRSTASSTAARAALPSRLATLAPFDLSGAVQREFVLGPGLSINGERMTHVMEPGMEMGGRGEASTLHMQLGDTEVWTITNPSRQAHAFHVHDVQFQVLSRNGQAPPLAERGRKDTVRLQPGERVRIAMRWRDYADPDTPYMYHCHVLRHEDRGMMGQFVVEEPSTAA